VTMSSGSIFLVSGTNPLLMFTGSGRTETTTAPCSVSTLAGVYSLVMTGRSLNAAGMLTGTYQGVGTANFESGGNVVFAVTADTIQSPDAPTGTLSGTWTFGSNCTGTVDITSGDSASFTLAAYNAGKNFTITGGDAPFALTGSGAQQPVPALPARSPEPMPSAALATATAPPE
jgi:hypothetical protein